MKKILLILALAVTGCHNRDVPDTRPATGILYNESLLVTGDGSVYYAGGAGIGKIDLFSGLVLWSHQGIYEQPDIPDDPPSDFRVGPGHFSSFEVPVQKGDTVLFEENPGIL